MGRYQVTPKINHTLFDNQFAKSAAITKPKKLISNEEEDFVIKSTESS